MVDYYCVSCFGDVILTDRLGPSAYMTNTHSLERERERDLVIIVQSDSHSITDICCIKC